MKNDANEETIWAYLLHLGCNMWADRLIPGREDEYICFRPYLRCETELWNEVVKEMAEAGMNMAVIDVADGVEYESHPEIAVRRAWSPKRLRRELARMRRLGIEPIPKLNFSTCHDAWMGPYARMVSTDAYYAVCRDLIEEVIDLFDGPRFFHLGMDEETAQHQRLYEYVVIRQHDLWWRDLFFYIEAVEKGGSRPWVWSDYVWHYPEIFYAKMPTSVLQSNWYYQDSFSISQRRNPRSFHRVRAYLELDERGYDQVPTGSNHSFPENFQKTVEYGKKRLAPERLKGFLQTVWRPTQAIYRDRHLEAVQLVGAAKRAWTRKG